jgi:hypothetical protein
MGRNGRFEAYTDTQRQVGISSDTEQNTDNSGSRYSVWSFEYRTG